VRRLRFAESLAFALALLLLVACGGAPAPGDGAPEQSAPAEPHGAAPDGDLDDAGLLDTPAAARLAWLVEAMSSVQTAMSAAVEEAFTEEFLAQVPPEQLRAALMQLAAAGPLTVRSARRLDDDRVEAVLVDARGGTYQLRLVVEEEPPHRIAGFAARLADYLASDLPASWRDVEAALREQGEAVGLLAARLDEGGACLPIYEVDADRPLAIGSAFKLWVLGALVQAVAGGLARWDESLPVEPAWRSISDPRLRGEADGAPLTLQDHAEAMISVSDNSATDHLIHRLGRERVEAAMVAMGSDTPERNIPFLTTRALFALKLLWNDARRDAYFAADEATRRALLEEAETAELGPILWASLSWTTPREIDRLEYFASPRDLCRTMAALREMGASEAGAPVIDVLSRNSGIGFDTTTWSWIGFKGGSEMGVLNGTWLVRRADDEWFVLAVTANDTRSEIDLSAVMRLAAAGFNLLATED
jgi:beta-lactamase class A